MEREKPSRGCVSDVDAAGQRQEEACPTSEDCYAVSREEPCNYKFNKDLQMCRTGVGLPRHPSLFAAGKLSSVEETNGKKREDETASQALCLICDT